MNLSRGRTVLSGYRAGEDSPAIGDPSTNDETRRDGPPSARRSDGDLIRAMQAGDLDAFEAFFARHRSIVFRTAYGLTGDRGLAEEVLQDTFTRAYQRRADLLSDVSPVPWLHRVALNLCYSRLGRRRLDARSIDESAAVLRDGASEPAERAEQAELRMIVRQGIAALPERQRGVLVLYYLHRMSLQETADVLGIRLGTVKSRLHYGLRGLRSHLERDRRFRGAYGPTAAESVKAEAS